MKNPLYDIVCGSGGGASSTGSASDSTTIPGTGKVGAAEGGGPNGAHVRLQQRQGIQKNENVAAGGNGGGTSPLIDADEDVTASLRSLQKESEEEVCPDCSMSLTHP